VDPNDSFCLTHVDFQEDGWTHFDVNCPQAAVRQVTAPAVTPAETALALLVPPVADAVGEYDPPMYTILSDMDFGIDELIRIYGPIAHRSRGPGRIDPINGQPIWPEFADTHAAGHASSQIGALNPIITDVVRCILRLTTAYSKAIDMIRADRFWDREHKQWHSVRFILDTMRKRANDSAIVNHMHPLSSREVIVFFCFFQQVSW